MTSARHQNPFTALENQFLDHLILNPLAPSQRAVFDFILRQTYGWHIPAIDYKLNVIAKATGTKKQSACRAVKSLCRKSILIIDAGQIRINPNVSQWGTVPAPMPEPERHQNCLLKIFIPFICKRKKNYTKKTVVFSDNIKKILELLPDSLDLKAIGKVIQAAMKKYGYDYIRAAVEYCIQMKPKNFCGYLFRTLQNAWHLEWKTKQAEAEADRLREQARIKEQEEKARELEKQAGQIRENRESLMAAIEAMPADVKAAYEQEFIETGMMNPFTQKQYQKRGMEGVKTAFIFFIEEKLNTGEVIT